VSTLLTLRSIEYIQTSLFIRAELGEGNDPGEHEEVIRRDAATIQDIHNLLKPTGQNGGATEDNTETDTTSLLSTIVQSNLSQLVIVRKAHQTKRAANSVKTRANPQDATPDQPLGPTDRQRLCAQMADVIRRVGSGLERGTRWKSGTAPGTRTPMEVQTLAGNSANAELAARQRVDTVRQTHYPTKEPPSHANVHRPGRHALSTSMGAA
jgi:hypothetical protein